MIKQIEIISTFNVKIIYLQIVQIYTKFHTFPPNKSILKCFQ